MNRIDRKRKRSIGERFLAFLLAFLLIVESSGTQFKAVSTADSVVTPVNLANYLADNSTMHITVKVDGKSYSYTPAELTEKGLLVPKGAPVKVELYFNTISKVQKGQTLVYQLPENLMDYSGAKADGVVWNDVVYEENSSGAEVEAADWVIDNTGLLTVTIRDDFFEANKHNDNTIDLFGFNIKFSGSLSSERGENSGDDDNVIIFRGETEGTGKLAYTIPFEYLNEKADVEIVKTLKSYDVETKTASYQIKVTAPSKNVYTATNVKVTDTLQGDGKAYVETVTKNGVTSIYQNYTVTTADGSFDAAKGVWTIGNMTPGQVETLTYDLVVKDSAYSATDKIQNLATVNYNNDGIKQGYATLTLPSAALSKTAVKANNSYMATDDNGTYMTYKLTVSASNGNASNLLVVDSFGNTSLIKEIVPETPSVGTVTIDNTNAKLNWTIESLKKGETATLTYKAYLDSEGWHTNTTSSTNELKVNQSVANKAVLYIDNPVTDTPEITDTVTTTNKLEKTWVKKTSSKVTSESDEKNGLIKYTIDVNGDPIAENVLSIYDILSTGATYEEGGVVTIDRYYSSDKSKKKDTTTIPLSEIVTTTDSGYRWDIDLVSRNLNGKYFYEITYYVKSSAAMVYNSAGIGFGVGPGYQITLSGAGSGGMTYGTDYSKKVASENKKNSYDLWEVSVKNTIPEGAIYEDWLSSEYVYNHDQFWFDDELLSQIVIEFQNKKLVEGVDYTVEAVAERSKTNSYGVMYNKFRITFNKEFAASSSNPLTIDYKIRLNTTAHDENTNYSDGCIKLYYNYCRWYIPELGKLVPTDQSANYYKNTYDWDTPLEKNNAKYNAATGEITWNLTINKNTTISGDATIEEYLPAGVSCDITDPKNITIGYQCPNVTNGAFKTTLGTVTKETYIDANGNEATKLIIPIKNLVAYYVESSRYANAYKGDDGKVYNVGPYDGWSTAGQINIKIITKVDNEYIMNMTSASSLTNKAVLKDNEALPEDGITATDTVTIPYDNKLIDKDLITTENPIYVEYALDINPAGSKLAGGNPLQVVDIMGDGMSLATAHSNSFKVYDLSKITDYLDSKGNVDPSKVSNGTNDITSQCTVVDITGTELNGMTEDEKGKPTYLITIPDSTHVAIVYWATFEGVEDESVKISNKASFFYNNTVQAGGGSESEKDVVASASSSSLYTGAYFNLKKTDQFGNAVAGVTYELYKLEFDSSGKKTETLIMTTTTASDGTAYFGHRTDGNGGSSEELKKNTLYYLVEKSAPVGYKVDSTPYYLEFQNQAHSASHVHPNEGEVHKFINGGTYSFTNQFTPASLTIPVEKLINSKSVSSTTEFSFTLKQTSGEAVYTDESYSKALTTAGISASVKGAGKTTFDTLYFTKEGTYTFTLSENDLSSAATTQGYTKDSKTYTLTVVVGHTTDSLTISSATYVSSEAAGTSVNLTTAAPIFNNGSHMSGTITLHAKKVVENRTAGVEEGEFGFIVSVGGEVVPETNADGSVKYGSDGNPVKKVFYTKAGGDIDFEIPIDQDDVGTQTYIISEVTGTDSSIKYTTDKVRVKVTIAETGNGKVEATKYEYLTDEVFTNEYVASGSLTITGTKVLKSSSTDKDVSQKKDEFHFVVKEGSATVATGSNNADGSITFTTINYSAEDIGTTHIYNISEVDEHEQYITYSPDTARLQVTVTDGGDGKLNLSTMYVSGKTDGNGGVLFTNYSTFTIPTGISIDVKPYLVVLAIVAAAGVTLITVRRKSKKHNG